MAVEISAFNPVYYADWSIFLSSPLSSPPLSPIEKRKRRRRYESMDFLIEETEDDI
jgi:hypothetical protein